METLVNAFMKKYPAQGRILAAYEKAVGEPMAWDNITKANLHAFTKIHKISKVGEEKRNGNFGGSGKSCNFATDIKYGYNDFQ